jgi:hypothetical protein
MKKSIEKWLKGEGYEIEYKKFVYWDNVPHAVKDDEEIPLALQGISTIHYYSYLHLVNYNLPKFKRVFSYLRDEETNEGCGYDSNYIFSKNGDLYIHDAAMCMDEKW